MTFRQQESPHRPFPRRSTAVWVTLLVWAVLLVLTPATGHADTHVNGHDNVLVLHSYGPDFVWTRSQQEGVDAVFGPLAAEYDLRIEYLDAVHNPGLLKGPLLLDLLRAKLSAQTFKVVLISDNAAFDFARAHRAELFPGVPIVFMGLNGYNDATLQGESGITGVAEDGDMFGTLQVLLRLAPQTKRLGFPRVGAAPPIFPIGNMRTRDGQGTSSQRAAELMASTASVPLFTSWDFLVGHGAVGGSVISGVEQGRLAAEIAVQVMHGVRPEAIPVRRGAGKTLLFDHRQLVRFDIPASQLPSGAVVQFSPQSTLSISQE